ncbi:hypothetical protein EDC04DRAFT_2580938, partial [Pisolithus marmoratus]
PLTYVEWFTTLHCCDPVTGLYMVSCSTQNHHPNMLVISVDHFICACHLQGSCGNSIDWTSNNVLEKAPSFHVNLYIDLHTFFALMH